MIQYLYEYIIIFDVMMFNITPRFRIQFSYKFFKFETIEKRNDR